MISLNKLSAIFLVPFLGYYITKLPLSPVYVFVIIGCFFAFLSASHSVALPKVILVSILVTSYFVFSQLLISTPNTSTFINVIFSLVIFVIVYFVVDKLNTNSIISISEKMVYFSIPLLIYEAYYRISNPIMLVDFAEKGRENLLFQYYKVNSVMYLDSNFVGIFLISLYFFLLSLSNYNSKKYIVSLIALSVLTILTLSRASIASLIIFTLIYPMRHTIYKHKVIVFLLVSALVIIAMIVLNTISNDIDDSLASKFYIFDQTINFIESTDTMNTFFGVGFGNAVDVLDIGAHNFFITYIVESGIFGLACITLLWVTILFKSSFRAGIVMFPFLADGMSLAGHAIPYLYAMFAIILVLESRRKVSEN